MTSFDIRSAQRRLAAANGGYELVHESPGLELGVYVLVAPEPDRQQPHEDDEVYLVLEGSGVLELAGEPIQLEEGDATFVAAGVEHRFSGYEQLSLLVIFARGGTTSGLSFESTPGPGDSEGGAPYSP
jgi:mannose-6-phosphate isomerase-like protein (cupin superfamily)